MPDGQEKAAIARLANAVLFLADAIGCVKKDSISQSQCKLAESFEADLRHARGTARSIMADAQNVTNENGDREPSIDVYADMIGVPAAIFFPNGRKPQ